MSFSFTRVSHMVSHIVSYNYDYYDYSFRIQPSKPPENTIWKYFLFSVVIHYHPHDIKTKFQTFTYFNKA